MFSTCTAFWECVAILKGYTIRCLSHFNRETEREFYEMDQCLEWKWKRRKPKERGSAGRSQIPAPNSGILRNCHPCDLPAAEWRRDPEGPPSLTYLDIVTYLVYGFTSFFGGF